MDKYKAILIKLVKEDYIYVIFLLAFVSMFGSLYFQFILNLPPCNLCYVQRYFMYPMAAVSVLLILFKKKINPLLWLILSVPGLLVALYHVYIQSTGTPNTLSFVPCNPDIPCELIDLKLFGFLTIPMMSLISFVFITALVIAAWYLNRKKSN